MLVRKTLRKPSFKKPIKPLIFVGMRQNIGDVATLAAKCGYTVIGILDQFYYGNTKEYKNIPIIGDERQLLNDDNKTVNYWKKNCWFVCTSWWTGRQHTNSIGLDLEKIRLDRIKILDKSGVKLANLIDTSTDFADLSSTELGKGLIIMGKCFIGSYTKINDHTFVDWQVNISQRTTIGKNCIIGGTVCIANYDIHDNVRIGVGAKLIGSKKDYSISTVGKNSIVHVGAIALDDIPADHVRTYTNRTIIRINSCDQ